MKQSSNSETISGNFATYYKGDNRRIRSTKYKLFSQQISLIKSLKISESIEEKLCFEFILMDKNYLMVLDYERLYEIVNKNETTKYKPLHTSKFWGTLGYLDGDPFLISGELKLYIEYARDSAFFEVFDFQLIFDYNPFLAEEIYDRHQN